MLNYVEYSKKLGLSRDFLSVYKKNRKLKLNSKECYTHYLSTKQEQDYLQENLQQAYIFLTERRLMQTFSNFLVKNGVYKNNRSIYKSAVFWFMQRKNLVDSVTVARWKAINKLFEEFKKEIK